MKHLLGFATVAMLGFGVIGTADAECGPYASNPATSCCYANKPVDLGQIIYRSGAFIKCVGPTKRYASTHFIKVHPSETYWKAKFMGSDQGSCRIYTTLKGKLSGKCYGRDEGRQAFYVEGQIKGHTINFGIATTQARFKGTLNGTTGKGTWSNPATNTAGTWTMVEAK